jgi:hypothetical protein
MDNDQYAIIKTFSSLKENDKIKLILLTKCLIEVQNNNNFNILDTQNCPLLNILQNYSLLDISSNNYSVIAQLYKKYDLFLEIKKIINKTTKIKNLNSIFKNYLENSDNFDCLKKFFKGIIIINLITKTTKNKSEQDIQIYNLVNKLNEIKQNLSATLYPRYENVISIMNFLNDDEYNQVYDLYFLFK